MNQQDQNRLDGCRTARTMISRRTAVGCSGLAVFGLMSGSALGQERVRRGSEGAMPRDVQERMEQSRAFMERTRDAGSDEERAKIMEDRQAWERTRAMEELKGQLEVSEQEWAVVKPRIEEVYGLVHPQQPFGRGNARPANPVERSRSELRRLLSDKGAASDQIKAKLTALRAAQSSAAQELAKARQSLRQLLTLRQEAMLVLNGLLD